MEYSITGEGQKQDIDTSPKEANALQLTACTQSSSDSINNLKILKIE